MSTSQTDEWPDPSPAGAPTHTVLARPAAQPTRRDRLDRLWDRFRLARRARRDGRGHPMAMTRPDGRRPEIPGGLGFVVLASVGLVLVVYGSALGWQRWSDRSAPPIDDLLPMLVDDEAAGSAGAAASSADTNSSADGSSSNEASAGDAASASASSSEPDAAEAGSNAEATAADATGRDLDDLDGDGADAAGSTAAATHADGTTSEVGASTGATSGGDSDATAPDIIVHVSGAVAAPGVVTVAPDARVYEAVAAAGGTEPDADTDRVNLAAPLVDGERVHIPARDEGAAPVLVPTDRPIPALPSSSGSEVVSGSAQGGSAGGGDPNATSDRAVVDLNRASPAELEALPGVGPTIAQAIADLRAERGPYHSVDELLLVDGIGPAKLEAIRPHAWVHAS